MAVCDFCHQEMIAGLSCTLLVYDDFPDDSKVYDRIRYEADDGTRPCHDCLCPHGGLHHPGCDSEKCPKCGGQAIGCGCMDEGEDEE